MSERKAFKDYFDRSAAKSLASMLNKASADFNEKAFVRDASKSLHTLEMMDRVRQFSAAMRTHLPEDVRQSLAIIRDSLPPARTSCEDITDGFLLWPLGQFVADHAVDEFDDAFLTMTELTMRFTSEFAIRPFLIRYPKRSIDEITKLLKHNNPHVRRWCSEGTRPRLPWGLRLQSLIDDPAPLLPILEALRDDEELYVRRSVANNLNDIAKDHPRLVVDICKRWWKDGDNNRRWLVRHAMRTLIKDGDPRALKVIGYGDSKSIDVDIGLNRKRIRIGESLTLSAKLKNKSKRKQRLLVDCRVHYLRKNGEHSEKVFKWMTLELAAGESIEKDKTVPFKVVTIRKLYPGAHRVEVQVNGKVKGGVDFRLLAET